MAPLVAQMVKYLPAMWETQVQSLGWEDPLEKEMAIHSSILAWRVPWTEEPSGVQSMGLQRVGHDSVTFTHSGLYQGNVVLNPISLKHLFIYLVFDRIQFCFYCFFSEFFSLCSFRSCDPTMFSLYNSGTVLPTGRMTLENYKVMLDFLLTAKKRKAHLPSGKINTLYTIKLSLDIFIHKWNTHIHKHMFPDMHPNRH